MAYKLFPLGTIPFIANGNPGIGYKVYTYQTGTTTPKASYTDSTGAVENANPVIFDQYGLKQIWLKDDINYTLLVKSSDDSVTFLTLNNVGGITDTLSSASTIAASTIVDANGNEEIVFTGVAGAVNYVAMSNNSTGSNPIISTGGDDANVGLTFTPKGSGTFTFNAGASLGGDTTVTGKLTLNKNLVLNNSVTPAQITATQNNYNPTSSDVANILAISSDAARSITGMANGAAGRVITLYNAGNFTITLTHEDAASTATNRFFFYGAANLRLKSNQSITLYYNASRWMSIAYNCNRDAAKFWVLFNTVGTTTISASYNVASLTDNGVGDTTVTFTDAMGSTSYAFVAMTGVVTFGAATNPVISDNVTTPTTTACRIATTNLDIPSGVDVTRTAVVGFGD